MNGFLRNYLADRCVSTAFKITEICAFLYTHETLKCTIQFYSLCEIVENVFHECADLYLAKSERQSVHWKLQKNFTFPRLLLKQMKFCGSNDYN